MRNRRSSPFLVVFGGPFTSFDLLRQTVEILLKVRLGRSSNTLIAAHLSEHFLALEHGCRCRACSRFCFSSSSRREIRRKCISTRKYCLEYGHLLSSSL